MNNAAKTLVLTTALNEVPLLANYEGIGEIDFMKVEDYLIDNNAGEALLLLWDAFCWLLEPDTFDTIWLGGLSRLTFDDRSALLDALKIHFQGVKVEENL